MTNSGLPRTRLVRRPADERLEVPEDGLVPRVRTLVHDDLLAGEGQEDRQVGGVAGDERDRPGRVVLVLAEGDQVVGQSAGGLGVAAARRLDDKEERVLLAGLGGLDLSPDLLPQGVVDLPFDHHPDRLHGLTAKRVASECVGRQFVFSRTSSRLSS